MQPNNQNAKKPDGEAASSFIQLRCRPRDKAVWVKAANLRASEEQQRNGTAPDPRGNLAGWVVDVLNTAAKKQLAAIISKAKPGR